MTKRTAEQQKESLSIKPIWADKKISGYFMNAHGPDNEVLTQVINESDRAGFLLGYKFAFDLLDGKVK